MTQVEVAINVTNAQLQTFRSFYEGEAAHGAGWFDMSIRTTFNAGTHRVRIVPNSVRATYIRDDLWQLVLTVETEEHVA